MRPAVEGGQESVQSVSCADVRDVVELTWGWESAWQLADFDRAHTLKGTRRP
jgi:hypothetical protein